MALCSSPICRLKSGESFGSRWQEVLLTWRRSITNRSSPRCTGSQCRNRSPRENRLRSCRDKSSSVSVHSTASSHSGRTRHKFANYSRTLSSMIDRSRHIRSMTTEAINHDPAHMFMNTGSQITGRPSMGSGTVYGLGTEAQDLPGFVVLTSLGAEDRTSRSRPGSGPPGFAKSVPRCASPGQGRSGALPWASLPGVTREQQGEIIRTINTSMRVTTELLTTRKSPPHCPIRNGIQDASECSRVDGCEQGAPPVKELTVAHQATGHLPPIVCWPGGWRRKGSASFSSIIKTGTIMAA